MSLNGMTLNSAALNSAAFLAFVYAEAAGAVTGVPSATVTAYKTRYASCAATTGAASVSVLANQTFALRSNLLAGASIGPGIKGNALYAAVSNSTATASAVAQPSNLVQAGLSALAGVSGYAIPANNLAGAGFVAAASGAPFATKYVFLHVNASAGSTSSADAYRKLNGATVLSASSIGDFGWKHQASGASNWVHSSGVRTTATALGTIPGGGYVVWVGNGFEASATSGAITYGKRIRPGASLGLALAALTIKPKYIGHTTINMVGTSELLGNISRKAFSKSTGIATATYSQKPKGISYTYGGQSINTGECVGVLSSTRIQYGNTLVTCGVSADVSGYRIRMANVLADAHVVINLALAYSNFTVRATDERSMAVPSDIRAMVVTYEDRIMRMAA